MTTATADRPIVEPDAVSGRETFADIARRLGDIPPDRIIWLPHPATEDDCVRYCEKHAPAELIDGFLVEKAMGFRESLLALSLARYLANFAHPRKLGLVGGADAIMRVGEDQLRLPDVSFVTWERLLATGAHHAKVAPLAPDLAVEVISEGNTAAEIDQKRREFLAAGTRLVWVINPKTRTAEVFADPSRPNEFTLVREADALDGGAVLPGFSLPLAELFSDLEPPAPTPAGGSG
ncbi:MAG: Uma2 family endonuclease [Gemmataceae bacterium]|nr:Uma2 family endonuclease [Gemmataceae bacterium]